MRSACRCQVTLPNRLALFALFVCHLANLSPTAAIRLRGGAYLYARLSKAGRIEARGIRALAPLAFKPRPTPVSRRTAVDRAGIQKGDRPTV